MHRAGSRPTYTIAIVNNAREFRSYMSWNVYFMDKLLVPFQRTFKIHLTYFSPELLAKYIPLKYFRGDSSTFYVLFLKLSKIILMP